MPKFIPASSPEVGIHVHFSSLRGLSLRITNYNSAFTACKRVKNLDVQTKSECEIRFFMGLSSQKMYSFLSSFHGYCRRMQTLKLGAGTCLCHRSSLSHSHEYNNDKMSIKSIQVFTYFQARVTQRFSFSIIIIMLLFRIIEVNIYECTLSLNRAVVLTQVM